jgi:ubiquinone/menaquinone biosynthesis C-methylase UbiE
MAKENQRSKKQLVMEQFGDKASAYASSTIHSRGRSLSRLVELLEPEKSHLLLDVATAAGHTAHAFAPYVRNVVAIDITFGMLGTASAGVEEKELKNIVHLAADGEQLPFSDGSFDLITCRIAAHHFPQVSRFMAESARVLQAEGRLAIVDNIVPGSSFAVKKNRQGRAVGRYVNAFERLRDPSHVSCLSLEEWQEQFYQLGFQITHQETTRKEMEFSDWAERMKVSPENTTRLKVMLLQAPEDVAEFLLPDIQGEQIKFSLTEMIMIGKLWPA